MLKLSITLLCLGLSFASSAIDFTIQKNDHYSTPLFKKLFRKNILEFKTTFNKSAIYTLSNTIDQQDTNKLFGFSDCGDPHTQNSARFGWRWWNNRLEIMAFTHKNGQFYYKFISEAQLDRQQKYSIQLSSDKSRYIFNFNDTTVEMDRGCQTDSVKGYIDQPYFGGNLTAPQDISIKIDFNDSYANFSFGPVYPNPKKDADLFIDLYVEDEMDIGFNLYDMLGRLVFKIPTQSFSAGQEYTRFKLDINSELSSGVYLVFPYAMINGEETPGAYSGLGNASKLIILK